MLSERNKVGVTHQLHTADEGQCTATTAAAHDAPELRAAPLHVRHSNSHQNPSKITGLTRSNVNNLISHSC